MRSFSFSGAAIAAAFVAGLAGTAQGSVITFDGFNGQKYDYWEEQDFLFSPAKSNNDSKCYETECLMEIGQGDLTTMTFDASGGGPYGGDEAPVDEYGDVFNLDFFYFVLIGNGEGADNSFTVTGYYEDLTTISATFVLGNPTGATADDATVSFAADADTNKNDTDDGTIQKGVGYWVDLGDEWNDLVKVSWFVNTFDGNGNQVISAQMRMDCVGANESVTGAQSGCAPATVVPVPAALPLLTGGLLWLAGLAGWRRRRRSV